MTASRRFFFLPTHPDSRDAEPLVIFLVDSMPRKIRALPCRVYLYSGGDGLPTAPAHRQCLTHKVIRVVPPEDDRLHALAPEEVVELVNGQRELQPSEQIAPECLRGLPDNLATKLTRYVRVLVRGPKASSGAPTYSVLVWKKGSVAVPPYLVVVNYNGRKHLARRTGEGLLTDYGAWREGDSLASAYRDAVAVNVYRDFHKVVLVHPQERKNGIKFHTANAFGLVDPVTGYRQLRIDFQLEATLFTAALAYQRANLHYLCVPGRNVLPGQPSLWLVSQALQQEQHANQANRKGLPPTRAQAVQRWIKQCPLPGPALAELTRQLADTGYAVIDGDDDEEEEEEDEGGRFRELDEATLEQSVARQGAWRILAQYYVRAPPAE